MQHSHRITRLSALALGIVGALAFGQAGASGFQIRENSVKNLGRANSGTAVAEDDASVVSNNPAAMVNLKSSTVRVDATVIDLSASFTGGGRTGGNLTVLNGGDGGDPGDPTLVPALAAVVPLSGAFEGLTLGASVTAPFGLKTEYDPQWVGRYNAIESDVKTVDLTLSAALALTDTFSVGASVVYERAEVTLSNAIDFGTALCVGSGNPASCLSPLSPFRPQANDGMVSVSGDDTSLGWIAGVQWRPSDRLSIGYSHRSEIDHDLTGTADFTVPQNVAAVFAATGRTEYNDPAIYAPLTTPSVDTLSVQYGITDSLRLMADYQRTDWHSLEAVRIFREGGGILGNEPFNWKDTDYVALGAEFDLSDAFTLRAGVASDESPTNDEARTPRLPDNDRMLYSVGATWNVTPAFSVDAAYTRIQIDSPSVNTVSSSGSRLIGSFSGHADLLGVSAQFKF